MALAAKTSSSRFGLTAGSNPKYSRVGLGQAEVERKTILEESMALLIVDYLKAFGWGLVGAITMAISLWILLKVFTWLTPIDEWEELRKGNLGIAIIMAAVIIGFAIVVGSMVAPPPIAAVAP